MFLVLQGPERELRRGRALCEVFMFIGVRKRREHHAFQPPPEIARGPARSLHSHSGAIEATHAHTAHSPPV